MRIASNSVSDSMVRQIQQLTSDQAKLQLQVSTGRRITQPEDDPAAVGRVLGLQSEQRQVQQFGANTDRALALAQTSYSGLQGLKKISDRAGELATLGTGAHGADAIKSYATETDQLIEQAVQLANTQSGGDYIYGGTAVDAPPFDVVRDSSGSITSVTYVGYGITQSPPGGGNSTRRFVNKTIGTLTPYFVEYANAGASGTCEGDSGGPGLVNVGGVEMVASVTSFGDLACTSLGASIRTTSVYTKTPIVIDGTPPRTSAVKRINRASFPWPTSAR